MQMRPMISRRAATKGEKKDIMRAYRKHMMRAQKRKEKLRAFQIEYRAY